jgi:hypothetical protein
MHERTDLMPTDELERELRRAFARRAAGYQHADQARQRLLQRDYRPGSYRRLAAGITAAAAAGAVVLGLGLSGVLGSPAARGTGAIRTAAFTLVEHANGTATLSVTPQVLLDPRALQRALRHDGIPALVTSGRFCSSHPIPAGFTQVVSGPFAGNRPPPTYTINPAAMRAGTELSFGIEKIPTLEYGSRLLATQTFMELIDTNSYTCSSAPFAHPRGAVFAHPPRNEGASVYYLPGGGWTLVN